VSEHRSLEAAMAWVDATTESLGPEDVRLPAAHGRVLAEAIHALGPIPCENRAALDGFAIQASASLGASSYNPIRLPLIGVNAGDALPAGLGLLGESQTLGLILSAASQRTVSRGPLDLRLRGASSSRQRLLRPHPMRLDVR